MQTRTIHRLVAAFMLCFFVGAQAAVVSRITTFSDGSILYASDLNSEFNNLVDNINNLDNDNISTSAAIAPSKLSATIAGDGISRDSGTGALAVSTDGVTIETNSDAIRLKDNGVSNAKLRQGTALSVIGNATNATANVADIAAGTDGYVLRRSGTAIGFGQILTAGIADAAVTQAKLGAANYGLSSSCGVAYTNNTVSFTDITNLSVTITTTGRPVEVEWLSDGAGQAVGSYMAITTTSSSFPRGFVKALRGATEIGRATIGSSANIAAAQTHQYPNGEFFDAPAAGTYTYKLQGAANSATSNTISCVYLKLYVHEI